VPTKIITPNHRRFFSQGPKSKEQEYLPNNVNVSMNQSQHLHKESLIKESKESKDKDSRKKYDKFIDNM